MKKLLIILLTLLLLPFLASAEEKTDTLPIPRTIIALYNSEQSEESYHSLTHKVAEMPLNHLGLVLEYYDINQGLPDIKDRSDVRGVLSWLRSGTAMENPAEYLKWATEIISSGKKFVVMGSPGYIQDKNERLTPTITMNRFLKHLGLRDMDDWISLTYDVEFVKRNEDMLAFERKIGGFKPPYQFIAAIDDNIEKHLVVRQNKDPDRDAILMATGPNGGYIAEGYAIYDKYDEERGDDLQQWYINPFLFFRKAFATDDLPKPDTTTIAGRRIYYSHIDGDGWNNVTQLEEYKNNTRDIISAQVILEKALEPYPDLPVTVAVIAADIDKEWAGSDYAIDMAKQIFALPQVEIGSHTYSHPFFWEFFADGNPDKEKPLLHRYNGKTWGDMAASSGIRSFFGMGSGAQEYDAKEVLSNGYEIPRAFAVKPFDVELEIKGSLDAINRIAPKGKKTEIVMWSGDTTPFEKAIEVSRLAGVRNINGGDSRFDKEYPSYCWVAPVGRRVGKELQVYASNSNENTYTDLWSGRYHGFRFLIGTLNNTESPIRVKPFNIYYHMYSGERQAALGALISNLNYARSQPLAPVTASHYTRIAEGFHNVRFIPEGRRQWRIEDRGALQTVRFDDDNIAVDFAESNGVIGQKYHQGSAYIYLDESVEVPVVALKEKGDAADITYADFPYLVESRWRVWGVEYADDGFSFHAQGFGDGDMIWQLPLKKGNKIKKEDTPKQPVYIFTDAEQGTVLAEATPDDNGILKTSLKTSAIADKKIKVGIKSE